MKIIKRYILRSWFQSIPQWSYIIPFRRLNPSFFLRVSYYVVIWTFRYISFNEKLVLVDVFNLIKNRSFFEISWSKFGQRLYPGDRTCSLEVRWIKLLVILGIPFSWESLKIKILNYLVGLKYSALCDIKRFYHYWYL